jgi:hypothetical protein
VKDFLIVLIVRLNTSIANCVLHDLVSSAVEDLNYVLLVVAHFGQSERNRKTKYGISNSLIHQGNEENTYLEVVCRCSLGSPIVFVWSIPVVVPSNDEHSTTIPG